MVTPARQGDTPEGGAFCSLSVRAMARLEEHQDRAVIRDQAPAREAFWAVEPFLCGTCPDSSLKVCGRGL